ncbi:MAG TPA: type VI secretion system baseplate subunit TssE [Gemmatimonadaceae bacterium]
MARGDSERTVQQSLLDRLIDTEPRERTEPTMTWAQSVRELKRSVHRDLEALLNTRRTPSPASDEMPELKASLYNFGLPDISSMSRDAPDVRMRLLRYVEETIALFEPRLSNVRASLVDDPANTTRRDLHFVIQALLRMDPNPEPVLFDTTLDAASGAFQVTGDAGA